VIFGKQYREVMPNYQYKYCPPH